MPKGESDARRDKVSEPEPTAPNNEPERPWYTPPRDDDPAPPPAGFLQVLGAVFWSFFGIRKRAAGERDMVTIKPLHVIIAGLLGAAVLVATLLALVTFITRKG